VRIGLLAEMLGEEIEPEVPVRGRLLSSLVRLSLGLLSKKPHMTHFAFATYHRFLPTYTLKYRTVIMETTTETTTACAVCGKTETSELLKCGRAALADFYGGEVYPVIARGSLVKQLKLLQLVSLRRLVALSLMHSVLVLDSRLELSSEVPILKGKETGR
jgi:hypothetical protein